MGRGEPTFLNWLVTAMAFIYFYQEKVDLLIRETGLGGAAGCHQYCQKPLASVITGVSLSIPDILGNSIQDIAREKAGHN